MFRKMKLGEVKEYLNRFEDEKAETIGLLKIPFGPGSERFDFSINATVPNQSDNFSSFDGVSALSLFLGRVASSLCRTLTHPGGNFAKLEFVF